MATSRRALRAAAAAGLAAALLLLLLFAPGRDGTIDRGGARPGEGGPAADAGIETPSDRTLASEGGADPPGPGADAAPAAGGAAAAKGSIRVRVLDAEDGSAVEGATLTFWAGGGYRSGRTDAKGEARFADLEGPRGTVLVTAPGRREARAGFSVETGGESVVVVESRSRGRLHGIVRSSLDGRPVAGASIEGSSGLLRDDAPAPVRARSAPDGRFSLPRMRDDGGASLFVVADGFVEASFEFDPTDGVAESASAAVELDPAGVVRGTVRDRAGRPVEGAVVAMWPGDGTWFPGARRRGSVEDWSEVRTDAAGAFRFENCARGGLYSVWARRGPGVGASAAATVFLRPDEREASADLVLGGTGALRVGWSPARPGRWVSVAITARGLGILPIAQVDAQEPPVEFEGIPEGPVFVLVSSGGARGEAAAEVAAGATTEVAVELRAGVAVSGTVVDPSGAPVADVRVHATRIRPPGPGRGAPSLAQGDVLRVFGTADTDSRGRFRFEDLPEGARVTVSCPGRTPPVEAVAPADGLVLVASATGSLRGRLQFPAGAIPPERMSLVLESAVRESGVLALDWNGGLFRIELLPVGNCRFSALAGSAVLPPREIEVSAGKTLDLGLLPMAEAAQTRGAVLDDRGLGVVGAFVRVRGPTHGGLWCVTIEGGRFVLGGLPAGAFELEVEDRGAGTRSRHSVAVGAAGADLALVHRRGGAVHGRVLDPSGVPLAGAAVVATPAAGGAVEGSGRVDHVGRYRIRVPAGEVRVEVLVGESLRAEGRATVPEGGESVLDLVGER